MAVEARRRMRQFFFARNLFREVIIFSIAFQSSFTNETAAFDAKVFLSDGERITAADFGHLHAFNSFCASYSDMRMCRRSQKIPVKPSLLRKARLFFQVAPCVRQLVSLRHFSSPTQRDRDGIVGVTGGHKR